jgi:hypothetical protein
MVSLITIGLAGCLPHQWGAPDPLVRPGSAVFYAISREERSGSQHSWKAGGQIPTHEVVATRFRAVDVRTCRIVRTTVVQGNPRVVAWDGNDDDLWFVDGDRVVDRDPVDAHSLGGRTIRLPEGAYGPGDLRVRSPLRVFDCVTGDKFSVWDVHAGTISWFPRRSGRFLVLADDHRMVAALPAEAADSTAVTVIPRTPGLDLSHASEARMAAAGLPASDGWLVGPSLVLAAGSDIVTFDVATGQLLQRVPVPPSTPVRTTGHDHPTLAVLRPAGASKCSGRLEATELTTGTRWERDLPGCVTGFGPELPSDPPILLLTGQDSARPRVWATLLQPSAPVVALGESIDRAAQSGNLLFYTERGSGPGALMMANLATGEHRQATQNFSWIEDFQADPASGTVVIRGNGRLLAYRTNDGRLDVCDGD